MTDIEALWVQRLATPSNLSLYRSVTCTTWPKDDDLDGRQLDWRLVARRYEVSVAAIPAMVFVAIIRVTQHLSARGSQRLSYIRLLTAQDD